MLSDYIKISRPRFWGYLVGPFLIGALAGYDGSISNYEWILLGLFGTFFLFPANLFLYGINDIYDRDTDLLNPKKQGYEAVLNPTKLKSLNTVLGLILAFVLGLTVLLLPIKLQVGIFGFFVLAQYYSSPPIRAKAKPFLDMVFNALYITPALVSYSILASNSIRYEYILAGTAWCMAMHAYSAIPDIESDKQAKLSTTATTLGAPFTLALCAGLYALSVFFSYSALGYIGIALGCVYILLMLLSLLKPSSLFRYYKWFPYINMVSGFVVFITILLQKI